MPTASSWVRIVAELLEVAAGHEGPVAAAAQHEHGGVGRQRRRRARAPSSSIVANPMALRTSGRSIVTTATPASISTRTPPRELVSSDSGTVVSSDSARGRPAHDVR